MVLLNHPVMSQRTQPQHTKGMPSSTNSHGADLSLSLSESSSRICEACLWYCTRDSTKEDSWLTCSTYTHTHTNYFRLWQNTETELGLSVHLCYKLTVHSLMVLSLIISHLFITAIASLKEPWNLIMTGAWTQWILNKTGLTSSHCKSLWKKHKAYHLTHTILKDTDVWFAGRYTAWWLSSVSVLLIHSWMLLT